MSMRTEAAHWINSHMAELARAGWVQASNIYHAYVADVRAPVMTQSEFGRVLKRAPGVRHRKSSTIRYDFSGAGPVALEHVCQACGQALPC